MRELDAQRQLVIQAIDQKNSIAFSRWKRNMFRRRSLDKTPLDAIAYVLIPPALLEQVDDPTKVRVIIHTKDQEHFRLVVAEQTAQQQVDIQRLIAFDEKYLQCAEETIRMVREKKHYSLLPQPPVFPTDIDPMYQDDLARWMVENGKILPNEKILTQWDLRMDLPRSKKARRLGGKELLISDYQDRPELRKKGIATQAYERLNKLAFALGIHFITGDNDTLGRKNSDFFVKKLGRVRVGELKEQFQHVFFHQRNKEEQDKLQEHSTVGFLYQKDKRRMLRRSS